VVINKSDLLGEQETFRLSALISELNPAAPQVCVRQGQVNWDFIQRLTHQSLRAAAPALPPTDVAVCSIAGDWADRDRLQAAIKDLGLRLLRLKGVVNFGGGQVLVESVFGSYQETRVDDLARSPGITAIGWKIGREELSGVLSPCIRSTDNLVSL
jgi:G3E family GTPase